MILKNFKNHSAHYSIIKLKICLKIGRKNKRDADLMMLLLLLLHIQRVLLHKGLQLRRAEYVLLQQLLHLMEAARRAEHHLRGSLRRRCPWRATGWRALGRIRR